LTVKLGNPPAPPLNRHFPLYPSWVVKPAMRFPPLATLNETAPASLVVPVY
jgi:hypothetical protein